MKWLALAVLIVLQGCAGGWEARQKLGEEVDGAKYSSGWIWGGPTTYIYPSGTVHRRKYNYNSEKIELVTAIDKALWQQIAQIVEAKAGMKVLDRSSEEDAICDGGYEFLHVKIGEKEAYYILDANACEERIERHDAAGRELIEIFRDLDDQLDAARARP